MTYDQPPKRVEVRVVAGRFDQERLPLCKRFEKSDVEAPPWLNTSPGSMSFLSICEEVCGIDEVVKVTRQPGLAHEAGAVDAGDAVEDSSGSCAPAA